MKSFLLETDVYVHGPFPVEFLVDVDGRSIRVAIEWSAIEQMMGTIPVDEERVREFLHEKRTAIAHAIEARLYAQGMPRTGELVMVRGDFDLALLAREASTDKGRPQGAGAGETLRRAP